MELNERVAPAGAGASGNVGRFLVFRALIYFYLWLPTSWIYLEEMRHMTPLQITTINGVGWLAAALAQVPTGVMADVLGRRLSLAMGSFIYAGAMLWRGVSGSFWPILLSGIAWTTAFSFMDGADMAFLYDELKAIGREDDYIKIQGRATSVMFGAQALGALVGAPLALRGLQLPYFACAAVGALAGLVALSMREPARSGPGARESRPNYGETLRSTLRLVRKETDVRYAILYYAGTFLGPFLLFYLLFQPIARHAGVPLVWMGGALVVLRVVTMGAAGVAERVTRLVGERVLVWGAPLAIGAVVVAMAGSRLWGTLALLAMVLALNAVHRPLVGALLQRRIAREIRATVISFAELLTTLLVAAVQVILGFVLDRWGVPMMLATLGLSTVIGVGVLLSVWRPRFTEA